MNATVRMMQTLLISNNGAALVLSNGDTVHLLQLQEALQQKEQRYEEEIGATLVSVFKNQQVLVCGCGPVGHA